MIQALNLYTAIKKAKEGRTGQEDATTRTVHSPDFSPGEVTRGTTTSHSSPPVGMSLISAHTVTEPSPSSTLYKVACRKTVASVVMKKCSIIIAMKK